MSFTAAKPAPETPGPERPEREKEEPPHWGMIAAYVALGAAGLVVIARLGYFCYRHKKIKEFQRARRAARPELA